jgi:hypothetical protein
MAPPDGFDKFEVGFFSFTEITDPNEHHSYNEWHMYDHMPEQYPIRGIGHGQRWVSTPACRGARVASGDALDPTHYLTCYLMTDPVAETLEEFYAHGRALAKVGRFHQQRRALLSGPLRVLGGAAAERVLVRPESVPFRPHAGIYVIVDADVEDEPVALDSLVALPGVAGAWSFGPGAGTESAWKPVAKRITVAWLDGDPLSTAPAITPLLGDRSSIEFAGPLLTITPNDWNWFDAAPTGVDIPQ